MIPISRDLIKCPPLAITMAQRRRNLKYVVVPSTRERRSGVLIKLSCLQPDMQLVGPDTLRCTKSGRWNASVPTCIDKFERASGRWYLDGSAIAMVGTSSAIVGAATLIVVVLCLVYCLYIKSTSKKELNDSLLKSDDLLVSEQSPHSASTTNISHLGPKLVRPAHPYRKHYSRGLSYLRYDDINYNDNYENARSSHITGSPSCLGGIPSWPCNMVWSDGLDVSKLGRLPRYIPDNNGLYRGTWRKLKNGPSHGTEC